jgi:hypothetical protein
MLMFMLNRFHSLICPSNARSSVTIFYNCPNALPAQSSLLSMYATDSSPSFLHMFMFKVPHSIEACLRYLHPPNRFSLA